MSVQTRAEVVARRNRRDRTLMLLGWSALVATIAWLSGDQWPYVLAGGLAGPACGVYLRRLRASADERGQS